MVNINQSFTDWFDVDNGVRQGCILSPTLFAMYIDDLMEQIKAAQVEVECGKKMVSGLLYVDDVVIISPDERKLQKLISIVEEWCKKWGMILNTGKTNIMKKSKSKSR